MRKLMLPAAIALLTLAACDKHKPEEPEFENDVTESPEAPAPAPMDAPDVEPEQNVTNAAKPAEAPAPPPKVSEEQQMQEDADATGLTTRLPAEGEGSSAAQ